MSDDRLKRRRFLADVLFAGGAVAGAGLLSRWAVAQKPTTTPSPAPTPNQPLGGEPMPPAVKGDVKTTPSSSPSPDPHPPLGGKPMPPK